MKRPAASEEAASTRRLLACAWTGPVGVSKVFINPALAVGTLIQFKGAMRVGDLWALGNTLSEPLAWSVFFWVVCPLKGLRPSPALTCPALALCPAPAPPAPPAAPPATPALPRFSTSSSPDSLLFVEPLRRAAGTGREDPQPDTNPSQLCLVAYISNCER